MNKLHKPSLNIFLTHLLVYISFISCENVENEKNEEVIDDKIIVNLDEFEPITTSYPYKDISIDKSINYWEFIFSEEFESEKIVLSTGNKCKDSKNQNDCISQYDSMKNNKGGVIDGCIPNNCFYYIKYQKDNTPSMITNYEELKTFLGEIDTPSDAILLASANSYSFSTNKKETGSIKVTPSGYELLMTRYGNDYKDLETNNRVLLEVTKNGLINILQSDMYY